MPVPEHDTTKCNLWRRISILATYSHRELCHTVIDVLRQLRVLVEVRQVRSSFIFPSSLFSQFLIFLSILFFLLGQPRIEVCSLCHLLLLMLHHIEEVLRIDFAISTSGLP